MALIRIFQEITNDVWKLTFVNDPDKLAETDKNLMRAFGEPEIEVGGAYSTGGAFTLPDKKIKLRSGFPFVQEFDAKGAPFDTNTSTKVLGYKDTILTRIDSAFTTLRGLSDAFTKEELHNI